MISFTEEYIVSGMCGMCCGLCQIYQNAESLGKSGCLYMLLACIFPCVPIMLLRQEARERYNIEVGGAASLVLSYDLMILSSFHMIL